MRSARESDASKSGHQPSTPDPRAIFIAQSALAAVSFLVLLFSPVMQMSDSVYSMLTAESIVEHGTPDLSAYKIPRFRPQLPALTIASDFGNAYQLGLINGKVLYYFPHGSSILSVPFVAIMKIFAVSPAAPDGTFSLHGELIIQKTLSAFLMAMLAVIFLRTALLTLNLRWSMVIAAGATFGTQIWSTASRGMWSHTWEIFLAGWVVYLLLRAEQRMAPVHPAALAISLALMYFVRPTAAVPIVFVTLYLLCVHRRDFIAYAIAGAICAALFAAYSLAVFGTVIPGYYLASRLSLSTLWVGLPGNLISPSRGLFVYVPAAGFVLYLVARHWNRVQHKALAILALAIVAGLTLVASSYPVWWGGRCYGARLLTDAVPWFVLLAALGCAAIPAERRAPARNPALIVGAGLLLISVAMNARGALSWSTEEWNKIEPVDKRVLDWSDPQFIAGLIPGHPRGSISH